MIVEINYANPFLVSKLIILDIKFEVFGETNFANDSPAKPGRQIKRGQHILRQLKNQVFHMSENYCRNNKAYEN